ncbi:MAG TPA: hypothetical protein VGO81_18600 [Solirubrobacteraceae bacterium]|jgi:hypothetical protein|nr:hypothetical protein [Solirubrobacteraceae bacterium]
MATSFDVDLSGGVAVGLPRIVLGIDQLALPKIGVGLDPLELRLKELAPVKVGITDLPAIRITELPPIKVGITEIPPIRLGIDPVELRLTQFPSIRAHLPADFHVGISVLGHELIGVRLCGEAQAITEPYVPNLCERCEPPDLTAQGL